VLTVFATLTRTCRFCGECSDDRALVKYQVRHYAHHACYLAAGKLLTDLHPWQVELFPFRVLKEYGLLEVAAAHVARAARGNGHAAER